MAAAPVHEDDVPLLDNAAAVSLFSPQLWVNRSRPRTQRRAAAPPDAAGQVHAEQQPAGRQSPQLEDLGMENEEEAEAEMEQLREDLQRLAALESMYTKVKLQNSMLERQLLGIYAAVNGILEENRCMKRLISLLQVRREDFIAPQREQQPGQGQQAAGDPAAAEQQGPQHGAQHGQQQVQPHLERRFLEQVGQRLARNLYAQPAEQQRRQAAAQPAVRGEVPAPAMPSMEQPQQQQDLRQQHEEAEGQQQQQQQQQQGQPMDIPEAIPLTPLVKAAPASLAADSPHIPAYRGAPQQAPGPMSADDISEEAQIAAAVLATTGGDATAALATLLGHAMAARQH